MKVRTDASVVNRVNENLSVDVEPARVIEFAGGKESSERRDVR
jgi:hypothetical protein